MSLSLVVASIAPSELASAWSPAPAVILGSALALVLYGQGFVRLRRRGRPDLASPGRATAFILGIAVIALAVMSPLDPIGEQYLLSGHMLQHVLLMDLGPALVMLGLSGPLLYFFLPRPALLSLARNRPVRSFLGWLTRPKVVLVVWAVAVAVWHVPALYDATLTRWWLHDLEHASFLVAGMLAWYVLVDPSRHGVLTRGGRIAFAVGLFAMGQILSMILFFSLEPLYPAYAALDERLFDISPLTDQRLAGIVMMAEQAVVLGALCLFLLLDADQDERLHAAGRDTADREEAPTPDSPVDEERTAAPGAPR